MFLSKPVLQLVLLLFCIFPAVSSADVLRIGVASNFLHSMQALVPLFEKETGHRIKISSGSTGKLYAQILHGAPFDVFFAANQREPRKLEEQGLAVSGSRFTYATGELVLYANLTLDSFHSQSFDTLLKNPRWKIMTIANPKTAPYGAASMEVLDRLNFPLAGIKLVKGENINQTWQFLRSGNADIGFVAASQVITLPAGESYLAVKVPADYYTPIQQQAIILKRSRKRAQAREFLAFLQRDEIRHKIRQHGYIFLDAPDAANSSDKNKPLLIARDAIP